MAEPTIDTNPNEAPILDSLPDPVIVLSSDRKVVLVNKAASDIVSGQYLGRDLALVLRDPTVIDVSQRVLNGQGAQTIDLVLRAPVTRAFTVKAVPVERSDAAVMLVFQDMTSIRAAEEMRADFVANVSHELRSPISSLFGFIETLQGPAKDDIHARARFLAMMQEEAARMSRLIDDLLSLSRVESEAHLRPEGSVNLKIALNTTAELLHLRAQERDMKIKISYPDELPEAAGIHDELVQVFQNLIDNALKYGQEGSVVTVTAATVERAPEGDGPGVTVSVHNIGPVIPEEHLPRLTERFYRVDQGRSRNMGGTGLGLAIVKHILNRHRGRMTIESTEDAGTTMTVQLPSRG